ncbi:hypothetical protein LMH73_015970 [Vibrio splendidus]|nr:hypothetical protein [Vibrio splendidus]MCC4880438.1 hypothetical protein [Vibrio splendidus]
MKKKLDRLEISPEVLVINKATSEYSIHPTMDTCPKGDQWIITQINRHTYLFDDGAEILVKLILKQEGYKDVYFNSPQRYHGLFLDLLYFVDNEAYMKVDPNHQDAFINIQRRKLTPLHEAVGNYQKYAE